MKTSNLISLAFKKGHSPPRTRFLVAIAGVFMSANMLALPEALVDLGVAGNFSVLSGAAITDTTGTSIDGNVGASPITGAAIGLTAGQVNGIIYKVDAAGPIGLIDPALLIIAHLDLTAAYNDAAGRVLPTLLPGGALGGEILPPGLYKHDAALASLGLTGTLTLDALGDPNAVWIFQSESTVIAEVDSEVVLINGAEACNIFWQVGSEATLKTRAIFKGNIMADQSIVMQNLATLEGRALARIAGISFDDNNAGLPACGTSFLIDVPTNITVECDVIPTPIPVTLTEACSTQTTLAVLSESIIPGLCLNEYTVQRIWIATNDCGESVSATQMITVVDTTLPEITCPQPATVECESDVPPPDIRSVSASDNCGSVTISHESDTTLTNPCGGIITRTYRATDECGNFAECTQLITVDDDTAPMITCPPSPIVVIGDTNCVAVVPDLRSLVQVTDNCGTNAMIVTQSPLPGTLFTVQTNVILTATDICGNSSFCTVLLTTPCVPGFEPLFNIEKALTNVYFETGATNVRPAMVGEALNFVITIVNTGSVTLLTVPVVDTYDPLQLQYVNANPPSVDNNNDGVINWTDVGPLVPGASTSIVVNFIALCAAVTSGTNTVLVSPTSSEPVPPLLAIAPYELIPGALQGNVWIDLNGNGIIDENLAVQGLNGITIRLYEILPGATNLVDQTVTATMSGERGAYVFNGLPPGDYRVDVDVTTVPPTLNINTTPLRNFPESTLCGVYPDANFGFLSGIPSAVDLIDFEARADEDRVNLTWQTLTEWNNAGYNIFRATTPDGLRTQINAELIPGSADGTGRSYSYADPDQLSAGDYYYWLEDIEYDESARINGPVRAHVGQALPGVILIGSTTTETPGLYMVTADTFRRSGIHPASVDPQRFKVYVDQAEVASYVTTESTTFSDWDYVLFYVNEEAQVSFGYAEGEPQRMTYRFVFVEYGDGDVWTGSLAGNAADIQVATHPDYIRYLITGFQDANIWLLDITNPNVPDLLIGADLVRVGGETGLYFSEAVTENGIIYATGDSAVIRIESITP